MKKILLTILIIAGAIGGVWYHSQYEAPEAPLGSDSVKFVGGFPYYLGGAGISSSASSFTLTSFTLPQNDYAIQDSDVSDTFYFTLEPGNKNRQEFVSCTTVGSNTGGNVTISGCTRGLAPISPYTASSTLQFAHSAGSSAIISNPPQLYDKAAFKGNDETVTGTWTYTSTAQPRYDAQPTLTGNDLYIPTVKWVNDLTNQGAATSTETNGGIVELATRTESASSTPFDADNPHVQNSEHATSTPTNCSGISCDVWTKIGGKIDQSFLDLTEAFTWTGGQTFTNATATNATTTNLEVSSGIIGFAGKLLEWALPGSYASSTIPAVDANGKITFNDPHNIVSPGYFLGATTTDSTVANADSDFYSGQTIFTIPANLLSINGSVTVRVNYSANDSGGNNNSTIQMKWGGTVVCSGTTPDIDTSTANGFMVFDVANNNSASSQIGVTQIAYSDTETSIGNECTASIDTTSSQAVTFAVDQGDDGGDSESTTVSAIYARFNGAQ